MSEPKRDSDAAPFDAWLPAPPTVTFATDGCVMGHCQDVIVIVWGKDATASLIDEYAKLLAHVTNAHQQFSIVHIVPRARPLPSGDIRAAFEAIAKQYTEQLRLSAVLLVGGGFWLSAVRSLITSIQVLVRRKLNARVCGSVDEVATWLAPGHAAQTGTQFDVPQLKAAIEWMLDHPSVREFCAPLR